MIVPLLSLGGSGVISVLSNIMPRETHDMCQSYFDNDVQRSREIQLRLHDLISALFSEVNPIPVKAAAAAMGYCDDLLRLPLTSMERDNRDVLLDMMSKHGLEINREIFS